MSTPGDEVTVALQRAGALCELGRFTEAAGLLRQTIASHPEHSQAWSLLAAAELGAGNDDAAVGAAQTAISLAPEAEWPQRLASAALRRLGRTGESIHHAREAVRINPDSWPALTTLARSLAHNKSDLPEARELAARAVALAPNNAETHLTAGVVAAAAKNRSDAEASFRQALSIEPQNSAAHNELARMRMGGRHHTKPAGLADAATGFAASIRVNPRADQGRRNLEHVLRVFLAKTSYFIFIDAYLIARIGASSSATTIARLLPIALLAVPGAYAWRFVSHLQVSLRAYLLRLITHNRNIGLAVGLNVTAVACLLAAALAPESARTGLAGAAAASALIGRLILRSQVERSSRATRGQEPRPTLGTPVLWVLAIALASTAIIVLSAVPRLGAGAGVAAAICAVSAALIVRVIVRRRSTAKQLGGATGR
jgi:Flp pilus assembly protein TadD